MEGTFADPGFGSFRYLSLTRHRTSRISGLRGCLPCDGFDLRDFAGIQQCICGTAERGPDVESDDKFSRGARVDGVACFHDGGRREATGGLKSSTILGARPIYPLQDGATIRHTDTSHTIPLHDGDERP